MDKGDWFTLYAELQDGMKEEFDSFFTGQYFWSTDCTFYVLEHGAEGLVFYL